MTYIDKFKQHQDRIIGATPTSDAAKIATLQKIIAEQNKQLCAQRILIEQSAQVASSNASILREAVDLLAKADTEIAELNAQLLRTEALVETYKSKAEDLLATQESLSHDTPSTGYDRDRELDLARTQLMVDLLIGSNMGSAVTERLQSLPFNIDALVRYVTKAQISKQNADRLNSYINSNGCTDKIGPNDTRLARANAFLNTMRLISEDIGLCQTT